MNVREELYLRVFYNKLEKIGGSKIYTEGLNPFVIGQGIGASQEETKGIVSSLSRSGYIQNTQGWMAVFMKNAGVSILEELRKSTPSSKAFCLSLDEYNRLKEENQNFDPHYDCYFWIEKIKEYGFNDFIARILWKNHMGVLSHVQENNSRSNSMVKDLKEDKIVLFTLNKMKFLRACLVG